MEARPTEYCGVRFRSKCEAMFALYLDLRFSDAMVKWEYEPKWASVGSYVPDFAVRTVNAVPFQGQISVFMNQLLFFEYKPSRPTVTYIDEVSVKLRSAAVNAAKNSKDTKLTVGGFVIFGSIYTDDRGLYTVNQKDGVSDGQMSYNWLSAYEQKIKAYRFDLLHLDKACVRSADEYIGCTDQKEKKQKAIADLLKWEAARNGR